MNADMVRAERQAELRNAARAWRAGGLVGDEAVARIDALYPDDRQRARPAFRILLAIFTFIAGVASFSFVGMLSQSFGAAVVLAPLACLGVDLLVQRKRRCQGGVEEGLSVVALVLVVTALIWCLERLDLVNQRGLDLGLLAIALFSLAAVWRWGMAAYGAGGALAFYLLLAQTGSARLLWVAIPLALAWPLMRARRLATLPPSSRSAAGGALFVNLSALYLAVNHALAEHGMIEALSFHRAGESGAPWSGRLTAAATALLPLIVLVVAVRLRDRVGLAAGVLMLLGSLITLRYYVHIAPLWIVLGLSGAALIGLALGLRRFLDSGAGRERAGFTAEPLFGGSNRARLLELAATLVAFTPDARSIPTREPTGFEPDGGEFGGGGASGSF